MPHEYCTTVSHCVCMLSDNAKWVATVCAHDERDAIVAKCQRNRHFRCEISSIKKWLTSILYMLRIESFDARSNCNPTWRMLASRYGSFFASFGSCHMRWWAQYTIQLRNYDARTNYANFQTNSIRIHKWWFVIQRDDCGLVSISQNERKNHLLHKPIRCRLERSHLFQSTPFLKHFFVHFNSTWNNQQSIMASCWCLENH